MHAQGHPQQLQIPRQTDGQTNKLQLTHKQITTTHTERALWSHSKCCNRNEQLCRQIHAKAADSVPHTHSHSYNTNLQYGRLQQIAL